MKQEGSKQITFRLRVISQQHPSPTPFGRLPLPIVEGQYGLGRGVGNKIRSVGED